MIEIDTPLQRTCKKYCAYNNHFNRLTQTLNKKTGGADLNKFTYAYDTRDMRTGVQQQYGSDPLRQVNYTYDSVDQLKSEMATGGAANTNYSNAFDYDAMGNRTKSDTTQGTNSSSVRSSVNTLNQVTALSSALNGGPRVTSGFDYDVAGNTTSITGSDGTKTLFAYDDADRLVRIEKRNATDAPLSKSEFIYDYASRKAVSQEFTRTNNAWVKTDEKRRVFDGLDVVQERNASNEVTAQLVRDGNISGILARSTQAGKTFFGYDGGGNVTLLTDENGADVGRYRYDAFGNTLEVSGSRAAENPYRFSTKELHAASGLYDFGYRFYSPGLGRWINRDPIGEAGGVNLYGMVGNDPVNKVDLYGLYVDFSYYAYKDPKTGVETKFLIAYIPAVFVGNNSDANTVRRLIHAIETTWYGKHGGDTVFKVYIDKPTPDQMKSGKFNTFHILSEDFRSHAEIGGDDARISTCDNLLLNFTASHEIGHILGLNDEYDDVEIKGVTYSKPRPGWEGNIMASRNGAVWAKNVKDVIKKNNLKLK